MLCPTCQAEARRFGKDRDGNQRWQCRACKKTFSERPARPLGAMRLELDKALAVLQLLVEGMSVRAAMRVTGVNRTTILELLAQMGERCDVLASERIRNLPVQDVQADEVWGYVFCKEAKRAKKYPDQDEIGDAYCFTALERHTKLILAWHLGRRDTVNCCEFAFKLSKATTGTFQITTDGFKPYQTHIPLDEIVVAHANRATLAAPGPRLAPADDDTGEFPAVCGGLPAPDTGNPVG